MTTIDTATIAADLRAAVPWVRQGWTVGTYYEDGKICLTAAIVVGIYGCVPLFGGRWSGGLLDAYEQARSHAATDVVVDYLAERGLLDDIDVSGYEPACVTLVDWNDQRCRDGEHAAELLETVAADLEAQVSA